MQCLYLIARIDGARVAIESDLVESVVHVNDIVPVPKSDPAVAGLFALRSRVLTLIDSQYVVTGASKPVEKKSLAIIAEIAGHHFGLLVESVEDVVTIDTTQIEKNVSPPPKWTGLATALVQVNGEIAMIIDPSQLVAGGKAMAA
ncbi:chemotaxis protein CheW [Sphingorhabdus arenilitoris]|uniref:Chemotaxis protein CheW n=1 Tax=Sphingorhabdus arenilitoris TaxID=1490041 RepID=A0ABV8RG74_9SPHN